MRPTLSPFRFTMLCNAQTQKFYEAAVHYAWSARMAKTSQPFWGEGKPQYDYVLGSPDGARIVTRAIQAPYCLTLASTDGATTRSLTCLVSNYLCLLVSRWQVDRGDELQRAATLGCKLVRGLNRRCSTRSADITHERPVVRPVLLSVPHHHAPDLFHTYRFTQRETLFVLEMWMTTVPPSN